ncbi:hypothetical protein KRMM14A1259_17570 [Krasilnikovia sp. MM14-A1259]
MVSREVSTAPAMRGVEPAVVAALSRLLPAGFRARQHDEWTADLLDLADAGPAARWRYLFAAAWTLPTLRSFARRGTAAGSAGLHAAVPSAGLQLIARIMVAGIGVPVLGLTVTGLLNWASFMGSWPDSVKWPLWLLLVLPAAVLWEGGACLVVWLALLATIMVSWQRSMPLRQRRIVRLAGLATVVVVSGAITLQDIDGRGWLGTVIGGLSSTVGTAATTGLLGMAGVMLAARSRTLSRRLRVVLAVAGVLALATVALHHTPVEDMIWQQVNN